MKRSLLPIVGFLMCCSAAAQSVKLARNVEQGLSWLPPDTETIMVGQRSYVIAGTPARKKPATDAEMLAMFFDLNQPGAKFEAPLARTLQGTTVVSVVDGARKFRPPAALGGYLFEGCRAYFLKEKKAPIIPELQRQLAEDQPEIRRIGDVDTIIVHQRMENDLWTFYISQPRPDVITTCTDEGYAGELFSRMKEPQPTQALPRTLPEWKQVDTAAEYWAISHYNADRLPEEALLFGRYDKQAIGFVLFESGGTITARYLTLNPDAAALQKQWDSPDFRITLQPLGNHVFQLTCKGKEPGYQVLFLTWFLGYGVVI